uniref:Uncharacterized protein n=1 Tax=Cryptosporidium parvum TaxID=5807 RepID=F0X5E2_CRYPV
MSLLIIYELLSLILLLFFLLTSFKLFV